MSFANEPLRVRWPIHEIPPLGWRTRIHDINAHLAGEGPLVSAFREIRRIGLQDGDVAAQEATTRLVREHADLFPGDPGWTLAWAIVCDAEPQLDVAAGPNVMRRPFEEPVPHYESRTKRAGRNRFRARPERAPEENRDLLDRLRGRLGRPPETFREVADRLRVDSRAFHKRIETLKKLGVRFLSSEDQKLVAAIFEPWAFRLRRDGKLSARGGGLSHHKAVPMTQDEATWRTGKALSELTDTYHCETFMQGRLGDPVLTEMIKVPPELILFPPRQSASGEPLS